MILSISSCYYSLRWPYCSVQVVCFLAMSAESFAPSPRFVVSLAPPPKARQSQSTACFAAAKKEPPDYSSTSSSNSTANPSSSPPNNDSNNGDVESSSLSVSIHDTNDTNDKNDWSTALTQLQEKVNYQEIILLAAAQERQQQGQEFQQQQQLHSMQVTTDQVETSFSKKLKVVDENFPKSQKVSTRNSNDNWKLRQYKYSKETQPYFAAKCSPSIGR
jgi:hypothetical protein